MFQTDILKSNFFYVFSQTSPLVFFELPALRLLEMFKVLSYHVFPLKFYFSRCFMFKMNFVCQKYKMLYGELKLTSKTVA